jgi:hypothetical protein
VGAPPESEAHNICNIVCSYFFQASDIHSEAAVAWAANSTAAGFSFYANGKARMSEAVKSAGINRFCEMAALLVLVLAFCIVGYQSFRVVSLALRTLLTAEKKLSVAMQPVSNVVTDKGCIVLTLFCSRSVDPTRSSCNWTETCSLWLMRAAWAATCSKKSC